MAKIMVVDDNQDNLFLEKALLENQNHEVITHNGGETALSVAQTERPDLILMDIHMPEVNGFELCSRLKEVEETADTPVIFITSAYRDLEDKLHGLEIGADDYIMRPVDNHELLARINVMLRIQQMRSLLKRHNAELEGKVRERTREIASQKDYYEHILESIPSAFCVLDTAGVVESHNENFVTLFGGVPVVHPVETPTDTGFNGNGNGAVRYTAAGLPFSERVDVPEIVQAVRTVTAGEDPIFGMVFTRKTATGTQYLSVSVVEVRWEEAPKTLVVLSDETEQENLRRRIADLEKERLIAEIFTLKEGEEARTHDFKNLIGMTQPMQKIYGMIHRVSQNDSTVLIHGESGTGKEVIAKAVHYNGKRARGPFVPVNCGAISPNLIESELFGHLKGSFTGATSTKEGLFRKAHGGTIFLDEISELPLDMQVKLLRVLQEGEIRPVGGNDIQRVDVRIIAATNRDLEGEVRGGRFRQDLYYRLAVVPIGVPPLRDRMDDIPFLVNHFVEKFHATNPRIEGVSKGALKTMMQYDWPGNVRELENCIERAFALGQGKLVQTEDLPSVLTREPSGDRIGGIAMDGVVPLANLERMAIAKALEKTHGDKIGAARLLGIGKSTLYRRLKEYEVQGQPLE